MTAERAGASASQTAILWRSIGFLLVTLQRQNSQVLAARAPSLSADVEGILGRPLSEDPEFWRAAPEAALLWSAEEFSFPEQRHGGAASVTAGEDHGFTAAGHLRAAGMRI